ncbi:MAG: hypothetical protein R6U43_05660 [Candidatus Krumholzibacteriales bacterium]
MNSTKGNGADRELKPKKGGYLRLALHVILISVGWIFFGYFWYTVIKRGWYGRGIPLTLIAMALFSVLLVVLISLWIKHNKNIARENRRKSVPEIEDSSFLKDKTGLQVVFEDISLLRKAPVVEIEIRGGRKFIRPGSGDMPGAAGSPEEGSGQEE